MLRSEALPFLRPFLRPPTVSSLSLFRCLFLRPFSDLPLSLHFLSLPLSLPLSLFNYSLSNHSLFTVFFSDLSLTFYCLFTAASTVSSTVASLLLSLPLSLSQIFLRPFTVSSLSLHCLHSLSPSLPSHCPFHRLQVHDHGESAAAGDLRWKPHGVARTGFERRSQPLTKAGPRGAPMQHLAPRRNPEG